MAFGNVEDKGRLFPKHSWEVPNGKLSCPYHSPQPTSSEGRDFVLTLRQQAAVAPAVNEELPQPVFVFGFTHRMHVPNFNFSAITK